jgi:hypothetical protein
MDDDSKVQSFVKYALGALGLGAFASVVAIPKLGMLSLWIALIIIVLALLLFGGYFWWQRRAAKKRRELFTSAIETQTAAAPKAISDPNKRASLDKLRQKFQSGLQEFRSRGKDIYQLPWHVIIGESGSGKTEAIRHSGIDFPPGLQDELQGSGGTVNMDWWFTNRGIILDTAGSMLFNESKAGEAPEWRDFLRLLKKARPSCPINGLFLVLSAESLIKDSAEKIAQKSSILAQQLDLIQRTLDVRFPVYLFVTKCDLLTGFREFFDNIDDPLLQHQMFGWSNPEPLDSAFRPDLVEQHLNIIATKVRRRRLALLRDLAAGPRFGETAQFYRQGSAQAPRRLDGVDSLFALPESLMRLAPRLRRYLETVFVAGEWSAKPVFLRGIYFTSSMREGKALDEAIAFATGLPLDQLPENRSWEKNRAFFLRDLFHEKVFRESGLVTRATNTLKLLRQRQLAIFGTAGLALLLLTLFAVLAFRNFENSVGKESRYWQMGANGFEQGAWAWPIVKAGQGGDVFHFSYAGTNAIDALDNMSLVEYQTRLKDIASKRLSPGWIFEPLVWVGVGSVKDRPEAQHVVFQGAVLKPLIIETRKKIENGGMPNNLQYHSEALQALVKLEADNLSAKFRRGVLAVTNADEVAADYLGWFTSYLTDTNCEPDTNLVNVMTWTYSRAGGGQWPPKELLGGDQLSDNVAIKTGLETSRTAQRTVDNQIDNEVQNLNRLVASLQTYSQLESRLLQNADCSLLTSQLAPAKQAVENVRVALLSTNNFTGETVTNIAQRYLDLAQAAKNASAAQFRDIEAGLPDEDKTSGIIFEILDQVRQFSSAAAQSVTDSYQARQSEVSDLDANYLVPAGGLTAFDLRWSLYASACALASTPVSMDVSIIGNKWARYGDMKTKVDQFHSSLATYKDPLPYAGKVVNACNVIAADAEKTLQDTFVRNYTHTVDQQLSALVGQTSWTAEAITNTGNWFTLIKTDLNLAPDDQMATISPIKQKLGNSVESVLDEINGQFRNEIGFPVLFDSPTAMSLSGLRNARELVNSLASELRNPVWAGDKSTALQKRCASCVSVVNSLLDDQGNPIGWELDFTPQGSDRDIITDLRFVQLNCAGTPGSWTDLAPLSAATKIGNGAASDSVVFSFSQDGQSAAQKINEADWGLIRLIHDYHAVQVNNDGTQWQIQIPLQDKAQSLRGNAIFIAKLINPKQPLPRLEDWPRQ